MKTDLIIYADNAHLVEFTPANYVKVIDDLKAGGMTNFKAAFTKVNRVVTEAGKLRRQGVVRREKAFVHFWHMGSWVTLKIEPLLPVLLGVFSLANDVVHEEF